MLLSVPATQREKGARIQLRWDCKRRRLPWDHEGRILHHVVDGQQLRFARCPDLRPCLDRSTVCRWLEVSWHRRRGGCVFFLAVLIGAKIRSIILHNVQACALLIAVVSEVFGSKCRTESVDICDVAWTFPWFIEFWFEEFLWLANVRIRQGFKWIIELGCFLISFVLETIKLDLVLGMLILKSAGVGFPSIVWAVLEMVASTHQFRRGQWWTILMSLRHFYPIKV